MTFPQASVDVVEEYTNRSRTAHPPKSKAIVGEVSVLLRNLTPSTGWQKCAERLLDLITKTHSSVLDCEEIFLTLDTYDKPAPHRVWVSQKRARKLAAAKASEEARGITKTPVDRSRYQDLATAPGIGPQQFIELVNDREWRQGIFIPWLTAHMVFPSKVAPSLKKLYLRGFEVDDALVLKVTSPMPYVLEVLKTPQEGLTLRQVNHPEMKASIRANATESDTFAASVARYYLRRGMSTLLVSGDGDLLTGAVVCFHRMVTEESTNLYCPETGMKQALLNTIEMPTFHANITSKLGCFNVGAAQTEMAEILSERIVFGIDRPLPVDFYAQIPLLICALTAMVPDHDTSSSIPYITAVNISRQIVSYMRDSGRFESAPPPMLDSTGKRNLLPTQPPHYQRLIYLTGEQNDIPQLNFVAWMSLIQRAAGFKWCKTVQSEQPCTPASGKPKIVSVAWLMAHLLRLDWTLKLAYMDHVPGPTIPDFGGPDQLSGYVCEMDGQYHQLLECDRTRQIIEAVRNDMGPDMHTNSSSVTLPFVKS